MSVFETQNEPFEISEELEALFKIRSQLDLHINVLSEQIEFGNSMSGSFARSPSPFITSFFNQFKEHFNEKM